MTWRRVLAVAVVVAVVWLFLLFLFDPGAGGFPTCPFRSLTGLLCPGCGAQSALHDLLHGRVGEAFEHNAALVMGFPLIGMQWGAHRLGLLNGPCTRGSRLASIWALALIGWGILRNLPLGH